MAAGEIAKNKTKTTIVMEKELKSSLEQIAKEQQRSFNNLMVKVLSEYSNEYLIKKDADSRQRP